MANILDLPPELLDNISARLLPHSIVPFVLTCKTIYARSTPIIDRHNAYRTRWRTSSHQGPRRDDIHYLLVEIARDSLVTQYVERLLLWDQRSSKDIDAVRRKAKECFDPKTVARNRHYLEEMVTGSEILKEAGVDAGQWWDDIKWENPSLEECPSHEEHIKHFEGDCSQNTTIITLLMFLPELKELQLPMFWQGLQEGEDGVPQETDIARRKVLTYLIQRARNISPHIGSSPLAKLETLLPYGCPGYDEKYALHDIEYFLPLPNLQTVYAVSKMADDNGGYTGIGFDWQPHNSVLDMALRRLELYACCCDAEGARTILSRTPLLEVFKFKLEVKWHGVGSMWEAQPLIEAIGECVGTTLKELAIITTDSSQIEEPYADFTAFQCLEELECGFDDLLEGFEAAPLVQLLPPSIKKVIFNVDANAMSRSKMDIYLSGFKSRKEKGFLEWQSLDFLAVQEDFYGIPKDDVSKTREFVESQGAAWHAKVNPADGPYLPRADAKAYTDGIGWDAEFCKRFGPQYDIAGYHHTVE